MRYSHFKNRNVLLRNVLSLAKFIILFLSKADICIAAIGKLYPVNETNFLLINIFFVHE